MRINPRILSIPPYISTSWKNVASLHVVDHALVITLTNGSRLEVPNLEPPILQIIFTTHAKYMEQELAVRPMMPQLLSEQLFTLEFPLKFGDGRDPFGGALQHNPEQANLPNLPKELLNKISSLTKPLGISDPDALPQPEPHCNCPHCQILKSMHGAFEEAAIDVQPQAEELVSAEDLTFRDWEIQQTADKLFLVTNPLDTKEHYSVFLGEPLGCTCGQKHCDHIRAVLKS